jgi:hypothetical protein
MKLPWRHRTKQKLLPKTPMEKARIAAQRHVKKARYEEAYTAAEAIIMAEATKISEEFGKETPKQCYQALLQRARLAQRT